MNNDNFVATKIKNIPVIIPVLSEKPLKQEKIKRIYEDDNFVIDLFAEDMVRVSIFTDGHFVDEVFVRKEDYIK